MGVSNDALLVYGVDLKEQNPGITLREFHGLDIEDYYEESYDFEDVLIEKAARKDGVSDLVISIDMPYEVIRRVLENRKRVIETCPIEVIMYCTDEHPMYFLAVRGAKITAGCGYAQEVKPEFLSVPQEKIDAATKWCQENGLSFDNPKWLLNTMNG